MGAVTTVGSFLDALRTVLAARSGLSGVNIFTGGVDDVSAGPEAIVFAVTKVESGEYERKTAAYHEVWEEYPVTGRVWITKPGAGETVIKAARDRALALLEQVTDALDAYETTAACQSALGVDDAQVTGWSLEQFIGDGYRDCRIEFTVSVKARFTPA